MAKIKNLTVKLELWSNGGIKENLEDLAQVHRALDEGWKILGSPQTVNKDGTTVSMVYTLLDEWPFSSRSDQPI